MPVIVHVFWQYPSRECPPAQADRTHLLRAVDRTTRWARRCVEARTRSDNALFGIVQGGVDPQLRRRSAEALLSPKVQAQATIVPSLSSLESVKAQVRPVHKNVKDAVGGTFAVTVTG